ncbi:MAG: protein-disulfide reductase DsbD domain-containing protein [Acidobacteriota bacterium]
MRVRFSPVGLLVLAAAFTLSPGRVLAQDEPQIVQVKGCLSRDAVRPGETFKAALILNVQAGYHINDNSPLDEFMIPTALAIADNPDFEVVEIAYPKGRRARFSYSEAELVVYEGQVVLGALLKAKSGLAAGPRTLKGALSYQACNDASCLPPREVPFEIAVPVVTSGAGTDLHPEIFDKLRFSSLTK